MKQVGQPTFEALRDRSFRSESLIIHRRLVGTNTSLLIFVHGLGGNRYGTWGKFPELIFKNFPEVDLGLRSYRTLFRRLNLLRSIRLDDEAELFAGEIRDDLKDYTNIIFFAHSLGGVLCMAAIEHFIRSDQRNNLMRIGGMILAGTPQLGSLKVWSIASWFSYDLSALKPHNRLVKNIQDAFKNHLIIDSEKPLNTSKILIPTWAMVGVHDVWVDKLSATIGLPETRVRMLNSSHTEIIKPKDENSENYKYLATCLQKCLDRAAGDPATLSPPSEKLNGCEDDRRQTSLPQPSEGLSDWVRSALTQAAEQENWGEDVIFEGREGIGKSAALREFLARARMANKRTALVHLSEFPDPSLEQASVFWSMMANAVHFYLQTTTRLKILRQPSRPIENAQEFINYVYHILPNDLYPLVIGIEEAGRLRGRPIEDDFHRMRRASLERDKTISTERRVQFALCGTEIANELGRRHEGESRRVIGRRVATQATISNKGASSPR